jgi:DNA-directed RNA polymerase subunit beta
MAMTDVRDFRKVGDALMVPSMTDLQTTSYQQFLQADVPNKKRKNIGLEAILREVFPIVSYDKTMRLEYIHYDLGKPRYTQTECRQLRLTYGQPFRVRLRLVKENGESIEEDVYLGELPIMIGGGEFIVNGAERVIVSQLHRSPGVDFLEERVGTERPLHSCRIIPERGSWVELDVSKREILQVHIDQSGKIPATMLLRAMDEKQGTTSQIIQMFYPTERIELPKVSAEKGSKAAERLMGKYAAEDVVDTESGEVVVAAGTVISEDVFEALQQYRVRAAGKADLKDLLVVARVDDALILNTLAEDQTTSHEEALTRIYQRLRPGNPPQIEKAKTLFYEKFFDPNRYRLGRVGRFRLNRKFGQDIPETEMTLRPEDYTNAVKYLLRLRANDPGAEVDDIDHLGNRRLRTIEELGSDEIRKGFLKLRRTVQERMNLKDAEELTPRLLVNSKSVSSAIDFFFGRSELSQVVDQTNPLAQLTHERRLSALGPGGLNRKRAGFDVRDVHISHYGRICPIETPEGTNIGLIASLGLFAAVDEYGFLITPYRVVKRGRVTDEVKWLRADEETNALLVPADTPLPGTAARKALGKPEDGDLVLARQKGDFRLVPANDVQYMDISPKQLVGVSAALIPFLEHDDANRALMGSNMQRQAVPLLISEPPIVATGMESLVAANSGMVQRARQAGTVTFVDASKIVINEEDAYEMRKYFGLNEGTCLNQRPIVKLGQKVKKGEVIADGAGTAQGELALGKNVLVAFMPYDGYNFEDAIVVSESVIKRDVFSSIHIEEFSIEVRETRLGKEEFTRDIPNVGERELRNLGEDGIVRVGTRVEPGDILVGKVAPKSKSELSPEEKLLRAIFGRAGEDVKNDSLEVPPGCEGIVIAADKFSRKAYQSERERKRALEELRQFESESDEKVCQEFRRLVRDLGKLAGDEAENRLLHKETGKPLVVPRDAAACLTVEDQFDLSQYKFPDKAVQKEAETLYEAYHQRVEALKDEKQRRGDQMRRGDELPSGVLEMVKVYIATLRNLSVGDKVAGRHGNKGVVARIVPEEDMPFLADGTPVEMILNPLGVPSRMNVGQILETHLGWAARTLGFRALTPVFDGAREEEIRGCLKEAGLPESGKVRLYDGRTGDPFGQEVTVGYLYMMKLDHLVDDKIHARATGPYSLITQQPLGGKARFGGQRFGEMEVWALEAYGAAYILQELLTVKSDDVEGRTKIYEAMVKGEHTLDAGTPVSFEVLCNEIRGLALNIQMERARG